MIGHLGRDPEMRYTPNGQGVTSFSIASSRRYTTSGGETVDKFRGDLVGDILFQLPNATGTGTRFTDIPVPSNEQINEIASKIL